jgi:hypothetical protein
LVAAPRTALWPGSAAALVALVASGALLFVSSPMCRRSSVMAGTAGTTAWIGWRHFAGATLADRLPMPKSRANARIAAKGGAANVR